MPDTKLPIISEILGIDDKVQWIYDHQQLYRVWREYLKLSDSYKDCCQWIKTLSYNPAKKIHNPEYMELSGGVKVREIIGEFIHEIDRNLVIDGTDVEKDNKDHLKFMLISYYVFFGDVFSESYEEFWQRAVTILLEQSIFDDLKLKASPSVVPLQGRNLIYKMDRIKKLYIDEFDREPSIDEFIDFAINFDEKTDLYTLSFLLSRPLGDITSEVKELVKSERKARNIPLHKSFFNYCLPTQPANNFDSEAHIRYLKVYDMRIKEGKTNDQVVLHFHPEINPDADADWDSTVRMYKSDYAKAKKVLENIEVGQFPGIIN